MMLLGTGWDVASLGVHGGQRQVSVSHSGYFSQKAGQNRKWNNFNCLGKKLSFNMVCQIVIMISRVIIPNFTIFVTSKVNDSIFNLYFPDFGFLTNCIKNIYIFISFHIK